MTSQTRQRQRDRPSPCNEIDPAPGCSATVCERQHELFAIADNDVREVSRWFGPNLHIVRAGRDSHGVTINDSAADYGAGGIADLERRLQGCRNRLAQFIGAGSIEEPATADARPFLELVLQLLVIDGESGDVDPDVDSLLDQLADGSLWIAAAGLLTVRDENDDLRTIDPALDWPRPAPRLWRAVSSRRRPIRLRRCDRPPHPFPTAPDR
jgi:hypothetical protein